MGCGQPSGTLQTERDRETVNIKKVVKRAHTGDIGIGRKPIT
jgi:hypothetical protein